jgi:hypothetical protein
MQPGHALPSARPGDGDLLHPGPGEPADDDGCDQRPDPIDGIARAEQDAVEAHEAVNLAGIMEELDGR